MHISRNANMHYNTCFNPRVICCYPDNSTMIAEFSKIFRDIGSLENALSERVPTCIYLNTRVKYL